jgi:predicted ATPase/class 3 adenylate cyclase
LTRAGAIADPAAAMPLPEPTTTTQTCALLLTDVVDSTQLAERLGDAAAAEANAAHDRAARDLLRRHGGREIDKTDGMLLLFERAPDAVDYALAYHAALASLAVPLQARAGLHVGTVLLRANPAQDVALGAKPVEVEGLAKPLAARVMSLARGGQTLLTAEARAALGDTHLRVQSHGHWRIKGLEGPLELFEVGDERTPFAPPPDSSKVWRVVQRDGAWVPLREVPNNLPAERDAFVGRGEVLDALALRFARGARLVSLLGIGGTGKTRLATQFAHRWLGDFPGGVWFCDLSTARNADGIVQAVAQALEVPLGKDEPVQQLGHAIAARGACLLILDNFEQVSRHAEHTLGRWLDRAAQACFLVTSREVLGLPGEEAMALAPLPPDDAASLFVRRAEAAHHGFAPDADGHAAIGDLVRLLDGLPLAIELAAARARLLTPRALLARMDQRFRLLAAQGGRRDRQATLRATFDWSWDLLSAAERSALAQLSVFEGGFTIEAVEAVLDLSAHGIDQWAVEVLHSLVDKSLVRRVGDERFDLLASVQEYAAEKLQALQDGAADGSEGRLATRFRHAEYFAASSHSGGLALADLDNFVAACRCATAAGAGGNAAATLANAWALLRRHGPFTLAVELAEFVLGAARRASGRVVEALPLLQAGLAHAREGGASRVQGELLIELGNVHINRPDVQSAETCFTQALAIAGEIGHSGLQCAALNGLASARNLVGDLAAAQARYQQALDAARRAGERRWEGGVLGNLGGLLWDIGDGAAAARYIGESLAIAREIGDRVWEANALTNLGVLHIAQEQFETGLAESESALLAARTIGHVRLECIAQCNLGIATTALGGYARARQHYEAALALSRRLQDRRSEGQFLGYMAQMLARSGDATGARQCVEQADRLLQSVDDPLSLGLLHCHRAEVELLAGRQAQADAAIAEAQQRYEELGSPSTSELGLALQRVRAARAEVGQGG